MKLSIPSCLSDTALIAEVKRLAACERQTTASLIGHLAELDARRLYLGAGCSSLFTYCTEVLRLSEAEAYNRIEAARAARRFPLLLEPIELGSLNLTTVRLLAPHLTAHNQQELVSAACGKSKREVEELVARHFPRPDVAPSVRRLPTPKEVPASAPTAPATVSSASPSLAGTPPPLAPPIPLRSARRRQIASPLAPDRYEIRFTASAKTREKLRLAQDLLRHAVPDGDMAEIFDRALTTLLDQLARKKFAATRRPGTSRGHTASSRHLPAPLRRTVWLRDGGRCAFVGKGGRRCTDRGFLEFHHVQPYGAGGQATVENIQLRCRAHNAFEAELYYGPSGARGGEGVIRERGVRWPQVESFRNELDHERSAAAQANCRLTDSARPPKTAIRRGASGSCSSPRRTHTCMSLSSRSPSSQGAECVGHPDRGTRQSSESTSASRPYLR